MPKRYNTPHRSRVVKTRLSEDEYADFTARLAPYGISQSEFLRQAIRRTAIRPVIHVSAVNDELLSAVGKLAAEYGRIGGNLNQIARYLNEYGAPYPISRRTGQSPLPPASWATILTAPLSLPFWSGTPPEPQKRPRLYPNIPGMGKPTYSPQKPLKPLRMYSGLWTLSRRKPRAKAGAMNAGRPVSYTHLDVYKRQAIK